MKEGLGMNWQEGDFPQYFTTTLRRMGATARLAELSTSQHEEVLPRLRTYSTYPSYRLGQETAERTKAGLVEER